MKYKIVLLVILSALLFACAQEALIKPTASGFPEGIFRNRTIEDVKSKIMDGCSSQGLNIYESGTNHVICGKILSGKDAVIASLAIGNSYSTTPERKVRFNIFQNNDGIKVVAQEWIETQMAYGQMRRQPLDSNNQKNSIQNFLYSLGAE